MRALIASMLAMFFQSAGAAEQPTMDAGQEAEVRLAVARGSALYNAFQANQEPEAAVTSAAREKIKDFCPEFQYRAIAVQEEQATVVYFIAIPKNPADVAVGRHYRVSGTQVIPSSKSCAAIPHENNGKTSVATVMTHLLSQTPTEFHVFESRVHDAPIFVITKTAPWRVQDGGIYILARDTSTGPSKDRPVPLVGSVSRQDEEFAPMIAQARDTYSDARRRFLEGLPRGEHFAVVSRLYDKKGNFEQVFIAVRSIHDGRIEGQIISEIRTVAGYKEGDAYTLPEAEILDWVISKPDGSEEGNLIGKYLDSKQ